MDTDDAVSVENETKNEDSSGEELTDFTDLTDSDEKDFAFEYIEFTEVEDFYGDKSMYQVYAPKGNRNENDIISYSDHGLAFYAYPCNYGSDEYLVDGLKSSVAFETEGWMNDDSEYKAAESLPATILRFNATYAPLTYNNNCDWEVVGGMEPSEYNKEFNRQILNRDWEIEDADSAIETIESLKANGHRVKCRECMEELEELGILDEKNEETFLQALLDSGIEDYFYRYVIAYLMHQNGGMPITLPHGICAG